MRKHDSPAGDALFAGPGEARAAARSLDWGAGPLGPVEGWAPSLRAAVQLCLDSRSAMAVWAGEAFVLLYNDGYAHALGGRRHPSAMGRPATAAWPEHFTAFGPELQQVVERGLSFRHAAAGHALHRDGRGEGAPYTQSLTPVREPGGRVVAVLEILEQAAPAARASEEMYRTLFDSIDEGVNVIELIHDESGRPVDYVILEANASQERMTGLRNVVGKKVREIVPEAEDDWFAAFGEVERTGEPARFEAHSAPLDRWFNVQASRLGGPGSKTLAIVFDDITERKRREANQALLAAISDDFARLLTEEEITKAIGARLAAHLDISTCSVADFADGVATVRSAFTRAGAVEAAATTLKVSDYLNEELQAAARDGRTVVIRDMRTDPRVDARRYEALGVRAGVIVPFRREGEWRHSFAVGTPEARDWREDEIQLLQDVASRFFPRIERARAVEALRQSHEELRAARARLEEADRRKDHFLAVLSHELRNPLSPVKNSLYVLDRVPPGGDQDRRARQVIARQIDLLAHLVDDLLDVTRITRGKVQLQRGRLELNELVRRTVEDHRGVFERAGVEVRLVSAPAEVLIDADRNRVSQIVSNLLQNAAKFTPREGRVTLTVAAEAPSRRAVVRVADTGAGMSREVLAHLFEPFMQADPTLDRSKGGLGLGLALVKGMVELHGGTVEAHSDGMGRGSTFTVRLPLDPSPPSARVGDHPRSPGVPRRVLVIEDNVDAAESLRDLLTLVGHEVAIAGNGPEGIARARAFRPQVVLCDIGLPGMDGYEVARAFRADAALRHAHLVALSGYALPEDLHRAAQAGFERHLAKPPSLEKLEGVLGATSAE